MPYAFLYLCGKTGDIANDENVLLALCHCHGRRHDFCTGHACREPQFGMKFLLDAAELRAEFDFDG